MSKIELIQGDCLEKMKELINNNIKVDAIITDLPYGTTKCSWDKIIQFDKMWNCVEQLTNNNTPILLFGGEPFSSFLRTSNIKIINMIFIGKKKEQRIFFKLKKDLEK
jgi:site-specific DNA-methyltransferase (adenine-specific)